MRILSYILISFLCLTGCGKKEPELSTEKVITPGEAANKLFVEAAELIKEGSSGENKDIPAAISAQIMKVLPHYLDVDDRHTKGVTLTERDLYQKELRDDPEKINGIRFDIKWSGTGLDPAITKLRVEIKSSKAGAETLVINHNATADNLSATWTPLTVSRADYKKLGKMESWRVSLWEGDSQVAEQKSFLW